MSIAYDFTVARQYRHRVGRRYHRGQLVFNALQIPLLLMGLRSECW